jgi:site-specific DNA-cytosine methylase
MSYTYLQEQGEVSSAGCFSDIPQSVLLRLNLTAEKSYSKDNETESCQSSQFGTMLPPSTELLGEGKSMSSAEASRVRTFQVPGGGAGIEGERSGLWKHMARIIGEIRPKFAFMENSPLLVQRGLAVVLGDIAEMGYDATWGIVGAHHAGANHYRKRIWILAYPSGFGMQGHMGKTGISSKTLQRGSGSKISLQELADIQFAGKSGIKPLLARREDDVANRSKRLKAIGNGQVPAVAATAWRILGGECGSLK